jgi:hypothetical protein
LEVDVSYNVSGEEKKLHGEIIDFLKFLINTNFEANKVINIEYHKDVVKELFDMDISDGCGYYFVRQSYIELCKLVKNNEYNVITGSPGIGKSLFLIYWLRHILKLKTRRNVYISFFLLFIFYNYIYILYFVIN